MEDTSWNTAGVEIKFSFFFVSLLLSLRLLKVHCQVFTVQSFELCEVTLKFKNKFLGIYKFVLKGVIYKQFITALSRASLFLLCFKKFLKEIL